MAYTPYNYTNLSRKNWYMLNYFPMDMFLSRLPANDGRPRVPPIHLALSEK